MKPFRSLALLALSALAAFAAAHELNLSYSPLQLKNGRVLPDALIKSFDHATGKVVIMSGRNLNSFQIELLPDEVSAKIFSLVPPEQKALARDEQAEQKRGQREQTQAAQTQERRREQSRTAATQAREQANRESAAARSEAQQVAQARKLAFDKADRYFRYEYSPGSGSSVVIRQGVTLEEPEEVPGWPGRYRFNGSVGLQFYDSRGSSFSTTTRRFEVLVQRNDKGVNQVVDFTLK